jgi:hypothetical protein
VIWGQDRGRYVAAVVQWFLGRQQSERERGDENLLSVARECAGPNVGRAPSTRLSLFLV